VTSGTPKEISMADKLFKRATRIHNHVQLEFELPNPARSDDLRLSITIPVDNARSMLADLQEMLAADGSR
jgi:hypothetical protein